MTDPMPANAVWQYDYIDYYRLDEKIIDQYLREKWGLYKYHVKVICTFQMGPGAWLTDSRQLVGDKYRFWVPQKLGKVCSFPSRNVRLAYMNPGRTGRVAQATKAEDLRIPTHSIASSSGDSRGFAVMFGARCTGTVTDEQGVLICCKECEWDKVAAGGADVRSL